MVGLSDILRTVRRQAEQVVLRHRLWRVHGLLVLWLRGQRQSLREPGAVRPAVRGFQGAGQSVLGLGAIMLSLHSILFNEGNIPLRHSQLSGSCYGINFQAHAKGSLMNRKQRKKHVGKEKFLTQ